MTNDLTIKQAVGELKAMKEHIEPYMSVVGVTAYDMAIKALEQQPKSGKWIFHKPFDNGRKNCNECIECSQCHIWLNYDFYAKTPYCPNCGADMRGEDNGE